MQFCDECGSMMKAEGDEMVCASCGASQPKDADGSFVSTERQADADVIETTADADFEGKPTTDSVICDECENTTAWYDFIQTASADEPPTRFLKCTECGHKWREYN